MSILELHHQPSWPVKHEVILGRPLSNLGGSTMYLGMYTGSSGTFTQYGGLVDGHGDTVNYGAVIEVGYDSGIGAYTQNGGTLNISGSGGKNASTGDLYVVSVAEGAFFDFAHLRWVTFCGVAELSMSTWARCAV